MVFLTVVKKSSYFLVFILITSLLFNKSSGREVNNTDLIVANDSIPSDIDLKPNLEDVETIERVFKTISDVDDDIKDLLSDDKAKDDNPSLYYQKLQDAWQQRQKDLKEANDAIIDEADLLNTWLTSLESSEYEDSNILLSKIEDMVHDVDQASVLVSLGGLEKLKTFLTRKVSFTSEQNNIIQSKLFHIFGTASKYHALVQQKAIDLGLVQVLSEYIFDCKNALSAHKCAKLVYAFGGLLRGSSDEMLKQARDNEVFEKLILTLIEQTKTESETTSFVLIKKICDLISDIVTEVDISSPLQVLGISQPKGIKYCKSIHELKSKLQEDMNICQDSELNLIYNAFKSVQNLLPACDIILSNSL